MYPLCPTPLGRPSCGGLLLLLSLLLLFFAAVSARPPSWQGRGHAPPAREADEKPRDMDKNNEKEKKLSNELGWLLQQIDAEGFDVMEHLGSQLHEHAFRKAVRIVEENGLLKDRAEAALMEACASMDLGDLPVEVRTILMNSEFACFERYEEASRRGMLPYGLYWRDGYGVPVVLDRVSVINGPDVLETSLEIEFTFDGKDSKVAFNDCLNYGAVPGWRLAQILEVLELAVNFHKKDDTWCDVLAIFNPEALAAEMYGGPEGDGKAMGNPEGDAGGKAGKESVNGVDECDDVPF